MRVHHCPQCDLRFVNEPDLKDHLVTDHGVEPDRLEQHLTGWTEQHEHRRTDPDLMRPRRREG